jgi:hypothetical protein
LTLAGRLIDLAWRLAGLVALLTAWLLFLPAGGLALIGPGFCLLAA